MPKESSNDQLWKAKILKLSIMSNVKWHSDIIIYGNAII